MSLTIQRPVGYDPVALEAETYLVRLALAAAGDTQTIYQSSLVIRGRQPILVDTGPAVATDQWMEAVFSLVEPEDVRWIFVSHNDSDHNGNLLAALAACPRATLLTSSGAVARTTSSFDLPYRRMRWLRFGETIDAGDRVLEVVDPPVYDSPITQGLFDHATRTYWAVDAFAAPVPVDDPPPLAADLPEEPWEFSLGTLGLSGNPWLTGSRVEWFANRLGSLTDLRPAVVASAHGPALTGARIDRGVDVYRSLPGKAVGPGPGQAELDLLLRAHHA
jgi:hypothetical protein